MIATVSFGEAVVVNVDTLSLHCLLFSSWLDFLQQPRKRKECSNISYKSVGSPKDLIFLSNLLMPPSNFGISDKIMNDEAHQGVAASEADANVSLHEKWSIFAMALR